MTVETIFNQLLAEVTVEPEAFARATLATGKVGLMVIRAADLPPAFVDIRPVANPGNEPIGIPEYAIQFLASAARGKVPAFMIAFSGRGVMVLGLRIMVVDFGLALTISLLREANFTAQWNSREMPPPTRFHRLLDHGAAILPAILDLYHTPDGNID